MVLLSNFFLIMSLGLILFFLGRHFQDYTTGILGGFLLFIGGLSGFLTPIENITELQNTLIASVFFGLGAYIWIRGSIDLLKEKGVL